MRESFAWHRLLPRFMAVVYYQISWGLYVIDPAWSYRLNARFEDHAEHQYMLFVQEHPRIREHTVGDRVRRALSIDGTVGTVLNHPRM